VEFSTFLTHLPKTFRLFGHTWVVIPCLECYQSLTASTFWTHFVFFRVGENETHLAENETRLAENETRLAENETHLAENETHLAENETRLDL
jgi:hypothetical protein